jgi:hypothetical protein
MDPVDPEAFEVLTPLVQGQRRVLGDALVGTYLFGSAATGWFEPGVSDVDTVVVLRADPTDDQHVALEHLHADLVAELPSWDGRVESVYLSRRALVSSLRTRASAARISPGEPFHAITVDPRWVLDWYPLRTYGIALTGPPVHEVAPPISKRTYVAALRRDLLDPSWPEPRDRAGDRCYAILTMCRGLRTCLTGEHVSKREGARWAAALMPVHGRAIADAVAWRARPTEEDADRLSGDATRSLVLEVQRRLSDVA